MCCTCGVRRLDAALSSEPRLADCVQPSLHREKRCRATALQMALACFVWDWAPWKSSSFSRSKVKPTLRSGRSIRSRHLLFDWCIRNYVKIIHPLQKIQSNYQFIGKASPTSRFSASNRSSTSSRFRQKVANEPVSTKPFEHTRAKAIRWRHVWL